MLNHEDSVLISVHDGRSDRLKATGEQVLIKRAFLPDNFDSCCLQKSVAPGIFWMIIDGKGYQDQCYCSFCDTIFNGSGGNLRSHEAYHAQVTHATEEDKKKAWFLFLLKHNVGLTCLRDPLARLIHPDLTYHSAMALVGSTAVDLKTAIRNEIRDKNLALMVDRWSDQSMRRFLGVAIGYYDPDQNGAVYRGVELVWMEGERHTSSCQASALNRVLNEYGIARCNCSCLVSDSAAVNSALAESLNLIWCPCFVHRWNLVVRNFIDNSPPLLLDLLSRINMLRAKSRWVEYMTMNTTRRNIRGYSPTRWCSVVTCLFSFHENLEHVKSFQAGEKRDAQPKFTDEDLRLLEDILDLMARFDEANRLLMAADQEEGLATVFEVVNAMYCILRGKVDGMFASACQLAADEIQQRFFNLESKACCKLIFAGILNVRHSIPQWLKEQLELVSGLLVSEVELFTGSTPPASPRDCYQERYSEKRSLVDVIEGSVPASERSDIAIEEVADFLRSRSSLGREPFTAFWTNCQKFRHVKMLASSLRSIPTNTVWIEQAFSRARRILTWNRMKMSPTTASRLRLLNANMSLTERILGFPTGTLVDDADDASDDIIEDEDLWGDE